MSTEIPQSDSTPRFKPLLTTTDWGEEWVALQQARKAKDDSSHWDAKAKSFGKPFGHSDYAKTFIDLCRLDPSDSVLDMGCGTGAIAIPLAEDGHKVLAADFSKSMLERLEEESVKFGVSNVETLNMSWEDDWAEKGLEEKSFDVCIASRSVATSDLALALSKLSWAAKRKCAITLNAGSSPRSDQELLSDIGVQPVIGRDFLYAFMILVSKGYLPKVDYIVSYRNDSYASKQDAFDSLKKMLDDISHMLAPEQVEEAAARLKVWVDENLIENPKAGELNDRGAFELDYTLSRPRKVVWAFISWEV